MLKWWEQMRSANRGGAIGWVNEIRVADILGEAVTKYDGKESEVGEKL
jgi:hypothetical protein